jgi:hypothetical protein
LRTLDLFKKTPAHTAAVIDEYGVVQGIMTRTDLLEAIAGDLPDLDSEAEPKVVRREDGSLLIDATMPNTEAAEYLEIPDLSRGRFPDACWLCLVQARSCAEDRRAFSLVGPTVRGVSYGGAEDRQGSRAACFAREPHNTTVGSIVRRATRLLRRSARDHEPPSVMMGFPQRRRAR